MRPSLRSLLCKTLVGGGAAVGSASAWAGTIFGTVTFSVLDVQAVPLLSDLMVLMLVALVAVLAYRGLRSNATGRPLASFVAVSIILAGGVLSGRFETVAQALPPVFVDLDLPGGGTVNVWNVGTDVRVQNQLSKPVKIDAVQATVPNTVGTPTSTPKCVPGTTVLPPTQSCYVYFIAG